MPARNRSTQTSASASTTKAAGPSRPPQAQRDQRPRRRPPSATQIAIDDMPDHRLVRRGWPAASASRRTARPRAARRPARRARGRRRPARARAAPRAAPRRRPARAAPASGAARRRPLRSSSPQPASSATQSMVSTISRVLCPELNGGMRVTICRNGGTPNTTAAHSAPNSATARRSRARAQDQCGGGQHERQRAHVDRALEQQRAQRVLSRPAPVVGQEGAERVLEREVLVDRVARVGRAGRRTARAARRTGSA